MAAATVGWPRWLQLVVVIAAEAFGAAGLLATIFSALPVCLMAFVGLFVVAFAFGGTEIVSETAEPARSVKNAVSTMLWCILVFYIGAIFVIAAVLLLKSPMISEGADIRKSACRLTISCVTRTYFRSLCRTCAHGPIMFMRVHSERNVPRQQPARLVEDVRAVSEANNTKSLVLV